MTKKLVSFRLEEVTRNQIVELAQVMGRSQSEVVSLAVCALHRREFADFTLTEVKPENQSEKARELIRELAADIFASRNDNFKGTRYFIFEMPAQE